jgi:lipopolysaccharide transport system ATP-binding protein
MKPAIQIEGLSKRYRVGTRARGSKRNLTESIVEGASALWRGLTNHPQVAQGEGEFWALKDVSFDVQPGEVVGIIGRNGAGKSTLLKILSRIAEPTSGRAVVRGRLASLLEVGTGFHPELTGRENIYLNGSIMGMSRLDIEHKFDEIVEFSGIEKFLDTPVKRYSSGMYVRLAFAVAAHLDPEILIVDEVLAVGDAAFQEKCIGKMKEAVGGSRSVVFVSHNTQAISQLTRRCILLTDGSCALDGPTDAVLQAYRRRSSEGEHQERYYFKGPSVPLNHVALAKTDFGSDGVVASGQRSAFEFILEIAEPCQALCFAFQVVDAATNRAVCYFSMDRGAPFRGKNGVFRLKCQVPKLRLFMGSYTLTTWLADRRANTLFESLEGICPFEVTMAGQPSREYEWRPGDCAYLEEAEWSAVREVKET